jgi:L-amino acid N-acyltransferase YncA
VSLADLARVLPDEPRWVETRFMLLREQAVVIGLSGDRRRFVASSTVWPVMAVVGRPEAPFIAGAARRASPDVTVLAAAEHADHVAAALPGWRRVGAEILRWPGGVPLPEPPASRDVRLLSPEEVAALTHVPAPLHQELVTAATYSPVAGAMAGGAPVAYCYATSVTETLWDVSIDTLEAYRRRGLAQQAVKLLAAIYGRQGKWPVWGAADDNAPSLALALKLGFVPSGRLAVFRRAPARPASGAGA